MSAVIELQCCVGPREFDHASIKRLGISQFAAQFHARNIEEFLPQETLAGSKAGFLLVDLPLRKTIDG